MENSQRIDYLAEKWVQRKLHSLIIDGYVVLHRHVQVAPNNFVWILKNKKGKELKIRQNLNVISIENKHKVIHVEIIK